MTRSKYAPITDLLVSKKASQWKATFNEIEDLLGFTLPRSARKHISWWANTYHAQGKSWTQVSWKSTDVNLEAECVTFVSLPSGWKSKRPVRFNRVIEDAKLRVATKLGLRSEQVTISVST